jgi:hypothetical protein
VWHYSEFLGIGGLRHFRMLRRGCASLLYIQSYSPGLVVRSVARRGTLDPTAARNMYLSALGVYKVVSGVVLDELYFQGSGDQMHLSSNLGSQVGQGVEHKSLATIMHAVQLCRNFWASYHRALPVLARVSLASRMLSTPHASTDPSLQRQTRVMRPGGTVG